MKISEIYEKFKNGETITVKNKGVIKNIKIVDGKYEVKYNTPSKAKFYGRLTYC